MTKSIALCAVVLAFAALASAQSFQVKQIPFSLSDSANWLYISGTGKTAAIASASSDSVSATIDLTTGKQLASLDAPAPMDGNSQGFIALTDKTAYISTSCGVQAFDVHSGQSRWCSNAVVSGSGVGISNELNLIFVTPNGGGQLVAMNATSGTVVYKVTGDIKERQPYVTFGGSILLIGGSSGALYGYDAKTGQKLWNLANVNVWSTDSRIQGFVDHFNTNYVVMLTNGGSTVVKVDAKAGKLLWSQPLVSTPYGSNVDDVILVYSAFSYFCYNGSNVAQISQNDGSMKHLSPIKGSYVKGLLNVKDQWILSLTGTKDVYYYDELDGSYSGTFQLPDVPIAAQNSPNQDGAYVLTQGGQLVKITLG